MKKNEYMKPAVRVTKLVHQQCLLTGTGTGAVQGFESNLTGDDAIIYKGASPSSGVDARGREYDCWGDEDEE